MKFSCPSCQAEYAFSDEGIAAARQIACEKCGRVLPIAAPSSGALPEALAPRPPITSAPEIEVVLDLHQPGGWRPRADSSELLSKEPKAEPNTAAASELALSAPGLSAAVPELQGWYAGVEGQPLGPLSLDELKKEVAEGKVKPTTLLWREGFAEWRSLESLPGLSALLEPPVKRRPVAAALPPRPASVPRPSADRTPSSGPRAPVRATKPAGSPVLPASSQKVEPTPPSAPKVEPTPPSAPKVEPAPPSTPLSGRKVEPAPPSAPASSQKVEPIPQSAPASSKEPAPPSAPVRSPALAAPRTAAVVPAPPAPPPAPPSAAEPVAAVESEPASARPPSSLPAEELLRAAGIPSRRRVPPAAWAALGAAVMLGVTIGFVLFGGKPSEPVVRYVEVPARSAPEPVVDVPIPAPALAAAPESSAAEATEPRQRARGSSAGAGRPMSAPRAQGAPAPNQPEPENPGAGGELGSAQVQAVVARHSSGVKHACWQTALETRDQQAPSSARVSVSITVAANGKVQAVQTSGDPRGYGGLANCIAGRVRGWQFPSSSGTSTVNVPFVFAAQ